MGLFRKINPGAKGTAIGTGKSNTQSIVESCGEAGIAAKLCTEYRGGGKSDWFLPSKDELNLIYKNLYKIGVGGFAYISYLSSSESAANDAWVQLFDDGSQYDFGKDAPYLVILAVRAF